MPPTTIEIWPPLTDEEWRVMHVTADGVGKGHDRARLLAVCPSRDLARTFAALYRIGGVYSADALENNRWELQER